MSASRQISIRIRSETDAWLERRAGGSKNKARFLRDLIEREMAHEKEAELLTMFNEAAVELTDDDLEERESLLGASDANPWLESFGRSVDDPLFDDFLEEMAKARAEDGA